MVLLATTSASKSMYNAGYDVSLATTGGPKRVARFLLPQPAVLIRLERLLIRLTRFLQPRSAVSKRIARFLRCLLIVTVCFFKSLFYFLSIYLCTTLASCNPGRFCKQESLINLFASAGDGEELAAIEKVKNLPSVPLTSACSTCQREKV